MPSEELMAKMQEVEEWRQKNKLLDYELKSEFHCPFLSSISPIHLQSCKRTSKRSRRPLGRCNDRRRKCGRRTAAISESVRSLQSSAQESPENSVLFAVLEQRLADSQAAARERLEAANRIAEQTEQIRAQFEAEKARCEWVRDLDDVNAEHAAAVEQLAESKRELARMIAEGDAAERILKEQAPFELTAWITKMSREALEQKRLRQRLAKLLVFKSRPVPASRKWAARSRRRTRRSPKRQAPETDSNLLRYVIDGDEDNQEEEEEDEAEVTPQNSPTATSPFELSARSKRRRTRARRPTERRRRRRVRPGPPVAVVDDENPLGSIDLNVSNQDGSFDFELDGGDLGDFDLNMDFGDAGGGDGGDGGVDISLNFDFDGPAASPAAGRHHPTVQLRSLHRGRGRQQPAERQQRRLSLLRRGFDRFRAFD
ncbi:hypothetical protein M3Y99_01823700 [Aphelenchoides fujianensis]|nr:hypothetical protein M3Y99_01823700 [Aphelenchoides fujianensis]